MAHSDSDCEPSDDADAVELALAVDAVAELAWDGIARVHDAWPDDVVVADAAAGDGVLGHNIGATANVATTYIHSDCRNVETVHAGDAWRLDFVLGTVHRVNASFAGEHRAAFGGVVAGVDAATVEDADTTAETAEHVGVHALDVAASCSLEIGAFDGPDAAAAAGNDDAECRQWVDEIVVVLHHIGA